MELCRPLLIKHVGALRDPFLLATVCFQFKFKYEEFSGVQWLRPCSSRAGVCEFDPWLQTKIPRAATKAQHSQKLKNIYIKAYTAAHMVCSSGYRWSEKRPSESTAEQTPVVCLFKFNWVLPRGSSFQHHVVPGTTRLSHSPPGPVPISSAFSADEPNRGPVHPPPSSGLNRKTRGSKQMSPLRAGASLRPWGLL